MYQTGSPEWLKTWILCMEHWFNGCFIWFLGIETLQSRKSWGTRCCGSAKSHLPWRQGDCFLHGNAKADAWTHMAPGGKWSEDMFHSKASPRSIFLGETTEKTDPFFLILINGMTDQIQLILHQYCFQDGWRKHNWFNFLDQFPSNLASNIQNVTNQLACVIMRIDKGAEWIVPLSFMLAASWYYINGYGYYCWCNLYR